MSAASLPAVHRRSEMHTRERRTDAGDVRVWARCGRDVDAAFVGPGPVLCPDCDDEHYAKEHS